MAGRGGLYQIRLGETKRMTSSILRYDLPKSNDGRVRPYTIGWLRVMGCLCRTSSRSIRSQSRGRKSPTRNVQSPIEEDINKFLLELENWNVKVKLTRIAFRKLIRNQIPDEAVGRMSMHQE